MNISMMTRTMSQLGASPEEIIQCCKDLGIRHIDWVSCYERPAAEIKKMSDDAGLEIVCHTFFISKYINGEHDGLDDIKQSIENAVNLGVKLVMIPTPALFGVTSRSENMKRWLDILGVCVPLVEDAGLVLSIENFPGKLSPIITADEFYEYKRFFPSLKLTFDNGNASFGEDPVKSLERSYNDIVHVHLKDWDISSVPSEGCRESPDGKRFFTPALVGEGSLDTCGVWNLLGDRGYSGSVNIEYEGKKYKPEVAMRKAVEYLRSL